LCHHSHFTEQLVARVQKITVGEQFKSQILESFYPVTQSDIGSHLQQSESQHGTRKIEAGDNTEQKSTPLKLSNERHNSCLRTRTRLNT
jgi:hypothetical protein